jgi:hypothetical protein|tara:strand:- start:25 stop:585 length:561 start_codon:yes stop_codon:yes gene_type:complete
VQDEEGKTYFYHQVTRQVRWTKPEGVLLEKMEKRIASQEADKAKRQHDRLQKLKRKEKLQQERMKEGDAVQKGIQSDVTQWIKAARCEKVSAFCPSAGHALLYALLVSLPNLLIQCDSGLVLPKNVSPPPQTAETEANHLKKSYMKTLRVIHPDKIPSDATVRLQISAKLIFAGLNEAFAYFKSSQ